MVPFCGDYARVVWVKLETEPIDANRADQRVAPAVADTAAQAILGQQEADHGATSRSSKVTSTPATVTSTW